MSFDQSLISKHKHGFFAPSWLAGTSSQALKKYYQKHDIEAINVSMLCDKLRFAVTRAPKGSKRQWDDGSNVEGSTVKEGHIPFRIASNLCYGTLRIYQQQVNSLLEMSKNLVSCSNIKELQTLVSTKRKFNTSSISNDFMSDRKKRRLSTTKSTQNELTISNYSELLDDLMDWQKETTENEVLEFPQTQPSHALGQIQIREITIREITATSYGLPEVDMDEGFGNATTEELADFFNFFEGAGAESTEKMPQKRKTSPPEIQFKKQSKKCNDLNMEPVGEDSNISPMASVPNTQSEPDNISINMAYNGSSSFVHATPLGSTYKQNCSDASEPRNELKVRHDIAPDIKTEGCTKDLKNVKKEMTKQKSKLVIDKCTEISNEELRLQIQKSNKHQKMPAGISFKKVKMKRQHSAWELLSSFNKRCMNNVFALKQKIVITKKEFESLFISLLHDIFQSNYNPLLISEIYPKWKRSEFVTKKTRNKRLSSKKFNDNLLNDVNDQFAADNIDINNNINDLSKQSEFEEKTTICPKRTEEWQPYGVMMKLLDLWRYYIYDIDAREFCAKARDRTNKALTFSSLLTLAANKFLEITKRENSIEIDKIKLGPFSEKLISEQRTSCCQA